VSHHLGHCLNFGEFIFFAPSCGLGCHSFTLQAASIPLLPEYRIASGEEKKFKKLFVMTIELVTDW